MPGTTTVSGPTVEALRDGKGGSLVALAHHIPHGPLVNGGAAHGDKQRQRRKGQDDEPEKLKRKAAPGFARPSWYVLADLLIAVGARNNYSLASDVFADETVS